MTTNWISIRYRDFWDVPRIFVTEYAGKCYLFDCPFDEETEDFPEHYRVSQIAQPTEADLAGSWKKLPELATLFLGEFPIAHVRFDESKRKSIDAAILDQITAALGAA